MPPRLPSKPEKRHPAKVPYWMVLLGILLAIIVYSPTFKADFVNWDDNDYVLENQVIQNGTLGELITSPVQGNYHPLTMLTLAFNHYISGNHAGSYHVLNFLIHLVNILLVFLFVRKLTGGKQWIAFTVSMVFAVHPLHVESVAWVSERKDVLYSLFFLWGLITYLTYIETGRMRHLAVTTLLFILSLLSKPAAIVFPLVLLAIDFYYGRLKLSKTYLEKIHLFILALVMGLLTLHGQKLQGAVSSADMFPLHFRFFFGFYGIMMYIVKAVWPFNLCTFYPFPPVNQSLPAIYYMAPLVSVLLLFLFIWGMKRNKLIAFSILFYIINLLLVLQFLPVGSAIIADRYAYLPLIGLFMVPGYYLQRWIEGNKGRWPITAIGLVTGLIILMTVLSIRQVHTWNNSAALWDQAIKVTPSSRAYTNRGLLFKREQNYDKAIEMYNQALLLNKVEKDALINRGNIYFNRQEYERAIQDYSECLKIDSLNAQALENRGAAYGALKQYDLALRDMDKSLLLNPRSVNGFANRGVFYQTLGRHTEAIADFTKQMEVNRETSADMLNSIAISYLNSSEFDKAIDFLNRAIRIKEEGAYFLNRAIAYYQKGDKANARADALKAQSLGMQLDRSFMASVLSN